MELAVRYTQADLKLITSSATFAAQAHLFQVRKELNEPYIVHPLRVANMAAMIGMPAEFVAACNLHDVLEDTNVPRMTMVNIFPAYTMQLVDAMTKKWGDSNSIPKDELDVLKEQYTDGLIRVHRGPVLKALDRIDNMSDFRRMAVMSPQNHKWATRYAVKTSAEFPRLLAEIDIPVVLDMFDSELKALKAVTNIVTL